MPPNIDEYFFILTIGGSTTESFYLDDKKTWPYLLQEKLKATFGDKIIVQNAGLDGHSTRGHLLLMNHVVPKVKPDLIIFLVGGTDLGYSLNRDTMFYGNKFENPSSKYKIISSSRLFRLLYTWKRILSGTVIMAEAAHKNLILENLSEPEVAMSPGFVKELSSLPEYEHNLIALITSGRKNNASLLFLTQPFLFGDSEEWEHIKGASSAWIVDTNRAISARTSARMLNVFNKKLLEVCQANDVSCFDLAEEIPHSQDYFYDRVHFNEQGSELTSQKIYEFIIKDKELLDKYDLRGNRQ